MAIGPGDVIWFVAGEKHWAWGHADHGHDAHRHSGKVDGKVFHWMEQVSDEQYQHQSVA
jgi:hypothetical protein